MSQVDVNPLLMGVGSVEGAFLRHLLPVLNARKLGLEVRGGINQRYCRIGFKRHGLRRVVKAGTKSQSD
jgi:hypothetical protein